MSLPTLKTVRLGIIGLGYVGLPLAVYMARHFTRLDEHPALAAWMNRLEARPAYAASLPAPGEGLYGKDFYEAWS